ncbi:MAG: hypothetical protein V1755_10145, partial [Chloroflexota bacterium]
MSRRRGIHTGVPMRGFSIFDRMTGYRRWVQMLASLRKFAADEVAQERLKILRFYEEHGEAQSRKYFGVSRKTIHVWRKKLAAAGQRLGGLAAHSTRPRR